MPAPQADAFVFSAPPVNCDHVESVQITMAEALGVPQSWGPVEADALCAGDGRWRDPASDPALVEATDGRSR